MKKINKVTLFVILMLAVFSLSAYATDYDIYVGGVQVTDENAFDVLGDSDEGATVTYDAATNTLTLNNAHVDSFSSHGNNVNSSIYSQNGLNIVLVGNNSVKAFPDENTVVDYSVAVHVTGDLTIYSEEEATLDVDVGYATRENFGFYLPSGGLMVSGKVKLDIKLESFVITCNFDDNYDGDIFGNSICIHCQYDALFLDEVEIRCETGSIFVPENSEFVGSLNNINSGGTTVGIAVYGDLVFDTTGDIYVCVNDSDGKRAGIASFSNFELKNGSVVVEMAPSKEKYLLAGPAVYMTTTECPCIPLCGTNGEQLVTGKVSSTTLGGVTLKYYANETGSLPNYTLLVTAVVGIPEIETNSAGESTVTVSVEDEEKMENALIVFSAYNDKGRMTDIKFKYGREAENGELSASLDLSEASSASIFVFESETSMKPIAHKLTVTDFA